ncbi:MAG: helix-turn-helix transcriptional regulator [Clostridia bacterium]|nr:helix-turn-helix transcriptional regulator [Clostridia bacterium]
MKNEIKIELIKNFMEDNNLSKNRFCEMCKISLDSYQKIMRNDFDFSIRVLFRVAKILGVEVFEMFSWKC